MKYKDHFKEKEQIFLIKMVFQQDSAPARSKAS